MNATRRQVPLVLCCADDGEVALVGVLDELHRKGHAPEVLMGVEAEPATLTAAVDRIRGPALFVLCESEDLDRTQVRRLSGLFSARRGPEHQLLIVQLGPGGGLTMLPKIEAALDAVAGAGPVAGDDDGYHMRDVIEPTGVSALRREAAEQHRRPDRAQAERIARELHDEMVAAEAVLVRRKAEREAYAPPSTPARRPAARRPASARAAGAAVATAGAAAPALDHRAEALVDAETEPLDPTQSDSPAPSAEEEAAEAPGVGPVVERRRTPSGSRKSGPRKSGPRKSAPRDARREEDDSPMANG
ncbi:MAG: hypothetical protein JKY37_06700, partial [Nannocystaceae bacterium]|nr:hypothetical protein [Nannocystaceae bacterium]